MPEWCPPQSGVDAGNLGGLKGSHGALFGPISIPDRSGESSKKFKISQKSSKFLKKVHFDHVHQLLAGGHLKVSSIASMVSQG